MAYTDIDKPSDYFNTKLYAGNATNAHQITGVGFQSDFTWLKARSGSQATQPNWLFDVVRGALKPLVSNGNEAEVTETGSLQSWQSDGFTLGLNNEINGSSSEFVSWNWKAGTSFTNDASGTGIGSIDSTGSVNTDAGFSIVSYTGTGSNGTLKHGLSTAPAMIIYKNRAIARNWVVYHQFLGTAAYIYLNLTNASDTGGAGSYFNGTSPTSSVFSLGSDADVNGNGNTHIAYCFAEKKGYSKFGSYTGNGNADGTFVYTGFKPAFCLVKRSTTSGENWIIVDNKRDSFNPQDSSIYPNLSNAEDADGADYFDFYSNGMKVRTTNGGTNTSGATYIYMAFAEQPFVTSTGVPATAR
jgi:hypothetical protein